MFTRTEATYHSSNSLTQLPPVTTEDWDQPTMICATAPDSAQEQLCLVKASAKDFVFVLR